jgi:hypothetical protein
MSRYFTLEQASAMLARIEQDIRQIVHLKKEHDRAAQEIDAISRKVQMMGGMLPDHKSLLGSRARKDATAMRLRELIEQVHASGVQIKDLDMGLIDFPTMFRGQEVCLCWKLGETAIQYWHSADEGYRGRKPIDQDFLDHHEGDGPD